MQYARLPLFYFKWHYTTAFADMRRVYQNILWFLFHFFSVGLLMRTLFSPWRRLSEAKTEGHAVGAFFSRILVNTIMRAIGFVVRTITIIGGCAALFLAALGGVAFCVIWILLPLVLAFLFIFSWNALYAI